MTISTNHLKIEQNMTKYIENLTEINFSLVYRNIATICKKVFKNTCNRNVIKTIIAKTSINPFELAYRPLNAILALENVFLRYKFVSLY